MPQINKPSDYFQTKLYTGNGSTQSITGVGFQPDWTWIKIRSQAYNHRVFDVVRGVDGNYAKLFPNLTSAENSTGTSELTSLDSDGFTLGSGISVNANTETYASWNWLADNTSGSSNTDGSITSTVSANTTSGFSIVSYTGNGSSSATVGHELGVNPAMVIIKTRNTATYNWYVKHKSLASNNNVFLNLTNGTTDVSSQSQGGIGNLDNSTTFSFSGGTAGIESVNKSSDTYIAYCFAEKKGFSKFSSYVGNGSTDGTFVYTGFKPAFVIQKRYSSIGSWYLWDNVREPSNVVTKRLVANTSAAEASNYNTLDFLSNGFKFRDTNNEWNGSGDSYIYMAFAENPLVGTNNIPATAR